MQKGTYQRQVTVSIGIDSYDGRAWSQAQPSKLPALMDEGLVTIENHTISTSDKVMRIDLEPIDPPVIFLPEYAAGMRFRNRSQLGVDVPLSILRGPEGEFRYQPVDERGIKYEVVLSPKNTPTLQRLPAAERPRYLALPPDLPERIRTLAAEWTRGLATPLERARSIERHLRTEFRYDLSSPSGKSKQPLDDFLFESKRGHCEFYSTAMAVMLRTLDVPTRNVTGFIGGSYNRFGRFYAVRQGDAHSWVEVFIDEQGWMTFDPTPPGDAAPKSEIGGAWAYVRDFLEATSQRWERNVVGYDLSLAMLARAQDEALDRGQKINFLQGDMREMAFENEFDAAYSMFTTFGYFDDETNRRVASGICRSLKPGGRFVLDLLNRDCLIGDLPTRVWWQGHGCVVLEEVDFNYFTSRLEVQRQIILEDGRQLVQDISIRVYSLHEIGKILHHAGFRVLEVSGNFELRNRFYGTESRQLLIVAEKRPPDAPA